MLGKGGEEERPALLQTRNHGGYVLLTGVVAVRGLRKAAAAHRVVELAVGAPETEQNGKDEVPVVRQVVNAQRVGNVALFMQGVHHECCCIGRHCAFFSHERKFRKHVGDAAS